MGIWGVYVYAVPRSRKQSLDDLGHGLEACKMRGGWRLQGKVKKEVCVWVCVIGEIRNLRQITDRHRNPALNPMHR